MTLDKDSQKTLMRDGIYLLTLNIGNDSERSEQLPLGDLVEDWQDMTDDEFDDALLAAWVEWSRDFIDGGVCLLDKVCAEGL
jgi:hypothetical protein